MDSAKIWSFREDRPVDMPIKCGSQWLSTQACPHSELSDLFYLTNQISGLWYLFLLSSYLDKVTCPFQHVYYSWGSPCLLPVLLAGGLFFWIIRGSAQARSHVFVLCLYGEGTNISPSFHVFPLYSFLLFTLQLCLWSKYSPSQQFSSPMILFNFKGRPFIMFQFSLTWKLFLE